MDAANDLGNSTFSLGDKIQSLIEPALTDLASKVPGFGCREAAIDYSPGLQPWASRKRKRPESGTRGLFVWSDGPLDGHVTLSGATFRARFLIGLTQSRKLSTLGYKL